MRGEADSIHLEPPGEEGIEFYIKTSTGTEYHQVKRQLTGRGVWSLAELGSRGVLFHFFRILEDPSSTCVFTSSHPAHPLDELVDRAGKAGSLEEFEQGLLDSDTWRSNFDQLHRRWDSPSKEVSFQRLRRIRVTTVSEESLSTLAEYGLETQLADNPSNALSVLLDFAMNQVHNKLSSSAIWEFLRSRGFRQQTWSQEESVADAICELNQAYEVGTPSEGIGGKTLPRDEVRRILEIFDDDQSGNTVLVSGRAGVGKTSAISQTLARLKDRAWPMLLLRVDRLEASLTPTKLGQSLGLPASPVSVLAALAEGRDCLLVVDQLDAISLASGRSPEFFDCIGAMLHQAQHHPNMKILTACRKYDIDNDHRLQDLIREGGIAKEVSVGHFDEDAVKSLVEWCGLDSNSLTSKQLDLLSLPIHLRLLSETLPNRSNNAPLSFQSATDLYDRFWEHKRDAMRRRVDSTQTGRVVDLMSESMAEHQALFVPAALLDEYADAVAVMVSENVIVTDGARISFFHEGFFDYIFARWFVSTDRDLVSHILKEDQSLFIRSQVRQVLLHQRDLSTHGFSLTVREILTNPRIRIHLKTVALSLLGFLNDPTEEEWNTIEPQLHTDLSNHLLAAIHGSAAWFDLLDSIGIVRQWLESCDDRLMNRVAWLLHPIQNERPSKVAELLSPSVGFSEPWNKRMASLFLASDFGANREYFDFALQLVDSGALDELLNPANHSDYVWQPLERLVEREPVWACKLIESYFQRMHVIAMRSGNSDPLRRTYSSHRTAEEVITAAANLAPREFVKLLLPFLTNVVRTNAIRQFDPPWRDPIWGHGGTGSKDCLEDSLFSGLESSLSLIAATEPSEYRNYAARLRTMAFHTTQNLLVRSYAAGGGPFADEAIEYVLEEPAARFEIDYVSTSLEHAITLLLRTMTPYCSSANLSLLQEEILNHYPEIEQGTDGRAFRGAAQLQFLTSIDTARLSKRAFRRLQELHRKFGNNVQFEPTRIEGGFVGSPIPATSASQMKDEDWLGAIGRYLSDSPSREPGKLLVGGAHQLSQLLEDQTKADPERFAKFVHLIPDDANPSYFEAILKGLRGADLEMDAVVDACLRCHRIPGRPIGRWTTWPLRHVTGSPLSVEALEMVAWYATEDPDPDPVLTTSDMVIYQGGQKTNHYDPLSVGINSVRGSAASCVARLVLQDERYLSFFQPYLSRMVKDYSDAVLSCVVEALLGVLRHNRDLAVELFLDMCNVVTEEEKPFPSVLPRWIRTPFSRLRTLFGSAALQGVQYPEDRFFATHHVESLLKYATQTHYRQLEPILRRMVESDVEVVAEAGARWVCYASLTVEEALPLASHCASGLDAHRQGAADVYAANIKLSAFRSVCEEALAKLFSDPNQEVRQTSARCFSKFEGRELLHYQDLARDFVRSPAFDPRHNPLIGALEETTADMTDLVMIACERVFELAGSETCDLTTATAGTSSTIAKLLVRVYSRATDPDTKVRCLDIIDKMSLYGAYGLDVITNEFDRQQ